jgi:hypothetical protein
MSGYRPPDMRFNDVNSFMGSERECDFSGSSMIIRDVWCGCNTCRWPATACRIATSTCRLPQAREAVGRDRGPQEPTGEDWWADVLADPRARKRNWRTDMAVRQDSYRLSEELRPVILVACSKCDSRAAFSRDELIASHGATCAMPSLLNELAKPGCTRIGNQWDHCGVYYVDPIGGLQQTSRE